MRVIITGGSGLIGRALTRSLVADGHEVVVLTRHPAGVSGLPGGARAVGWDGATAAGWGPLVEDAAIVHLAGENVGAGRWTAERKKQLYDSRVRTGEAVLAAVEQARVKPRALLQSSAVGFYGDRGDELISEESLPGSGFLAEICRDWEAVTADVEPLGVRRVVLRTGVVLAREGGALPKMALPFRLFAGGPVGSGRQWLPWIHLEDEVRAIRFLLDSTSSSGPYLLTTPHPIPGREFATLLGNVLRRPSFLAVPAWVLRIGVGEMAEVLLGGQRAAPRRLLEQGFEFRFDAAEAALRNLLR